MGKNKIKGRAFLGFPSTTTQVVSSQLSTKGSLDGL